MLDGRIGRFRGVIAQLVFSHSIPIMRSGAACADPR